jgi:hypothetical protein
MEIEEGQWKVIPPMHLWRADHTATLLSNGKVLIVGGHSGRLTDVLDTAELFDPTKLSDPATNPFTLLSDRLCDARRGHLAVPFGDNVLLLGGVDSRSKGLAICRDLRLHHTTLLSNRRPR